MRIDIVSLFPPYFRGPFDESIVARARRQGLLDIHLIDLRQYGTGQHQQVDDRAYGGGPGMVLMADPVARALRYAKGLSANGTQRTVFLSPQGAPLNAKKCRELAAIDHLILLCGHYEGVDQRVLDLEVDEEISIGDYVLTNGCLPAIVLVDSVVRFIPGVIGHSDAAAQDSFEQELLDCPHYTRPEAFEGVEVPKVLLEGKHATTSQWRHQQACAKTQRMRPDLFVRYLLKMQENLPQHQKEREQPHWRLQRTTLMVDDLRVSRRFYRDMLGLKPTQESDAMIVYQLGGYEVALASGRRDDQQNGSIVIQVGIDDQRILRQIANRMRGRDGAGIEGLERIEKVWFIDPDGYQWLLTGSRAE